MRSGGRRHSRTCPKPWSLYNIGSQRFVGLFQQRWGNSRFVDGSERTQPGEPLERGLGVGLRASGFGSMYCHWLSANRGKRATACDLRG